MKNLALVAPLLPLLGSAFVIPEEQVLAGLEVQDTRHHSSHKESWTQAIQETSDSVYENLRDAYDGVAEAGHHAKESFLDALAEVEGDEEEHHSWQEKCNGHWADSVSFEGLESDDAPPEEHKRPHHKPHHGHHGHKKPDKTVFQLIAESKYTTELAKLISKYDDLVDTLNGTKANFTVFAPTDRAFKKIPSHAPKPSKEFLKKVLTYHVSPDFYPAKRVLFHDTLPSALKEPLLKGYQRLSVGLSLKGLVVNHYSRIVAVNIFGTNGVIHGIDSLLLPPPTAFRLLNFLPAEFSTLLLAAEKTGLDKALNSTEDRVGGTIFAPSNYAFKKLGPIANAYLFSSRGEKHLAALLKYHISPNHTLYSDAYYSAKDNSDDFDDSSMSRPRRNFHVDLPTALDGLTLPVDIARYGPFISVRVNGFTRVSVKNGLAKDGVIQVVSSVLIPPKRGSSSETAAWEGGEISVEELQERLDPYVVEGETSTGSVKWEM